MGVVDEMKRLVVEVVEDACLGFRTRTVLWKLEFRIAIQ